MSKENTTKKIAYLGIYIALALIFSYVESFIPISIGIPGIKLGLANIVTVLMLYTYGAVGALAIGVLRVILSGFMFGNMFSIIYSLAGCLLSFCVMYIIKRVGKFNIISVSVVGGVSHNIGQLIVAAFVVDTYSILYYIPVLIIAGVITGLVIGVVSTEIVARLPQKMKFAK